MLNIDSLLLTEDECIDSHDINNCCGAAINAAKAQLAKTLWGYADYLELLWQGSNPQWEIRGLWLALLVDLTQAGLERPR